MKLLSEEVGFVGQENFGAFDLSKVESLSLRFVRCGHYWIAERCHMLPEFLCIVDDFLENLLFVWLEREPTDFVLPLLEILQLRSCSIARNSNPPVAYGTSVLLVVLDFTPGDLETFSVIPNNVSVLLPFNHRLTYHS